MTYYLRFTHLPHSKGAGKIGYWKMLDDGFILVRPCSVTSKSKGEFLPDVEETVYHWRTDPSPDKNMTWLQRVKIDVMTPDEVVNELFLDIL